MVLIALTGYAQREDRKGLLNAGFQHDLVKPVDLRRLAQIIATLPTAATESGPRQQRASARADVSTQSLDHHREDLLLPTKPRAGSWQHSSSSKNGKPFLGVLENRESSCQSTQ